MKSFLTYGDKNFNIAKHLSLPKESDFLTKLLLWDQMI